MAKHSVFRTVEFVSVHIVTYNSQATIRACIESVRRQTYKRVRVLVIDNASTDRTPQILRQLGCQVIWNLENVGYAAAHNQAIAHTSSTYVMTVNPDVVLDPEYIRHAVCAIGNAGADTGSMAGLLFQDPGDHSLERVVDSAGLWINRSRRFGLRYDGRKASSLKFRQENIFGPDGAVAFYKRRMLTDVSVCGEIFDEDFFAYKEDVDLAWRAQLFGWKSIFVPLAIGYHPRVFRPGNRKTANLRLRYLSVRNRYYLLLKNEQYSMFLRDVFHIFVYEMKILVYLMVFERPSLPAYIEAISNVGTMLRKRKSIHRRLRPGIDSILRWIDV